MTMNSPTTNYALGSTDAEHESLICQAARIAPLTERFFREAGIRPDQRVLDLGSGVGDVATLTGKLVGPGRGSWGRTRLALELEHAYAQGETNYLFVIKTDPLLDDLRGQPRFDVLVQKIVAGKQ
jgi:hypothetical protein